MPTWPSAVLSIFILRRFRGNASDKWLPPLSLKIQNRVVCRCAWVVEREKAENRIHCAGPTLDFARSFLVCRRAMRRGLGARLAAWGFKLRWAWCMFDGFGDEQTGWQ